MPRLIRLLQSNRTINTCERDRELEVLTLLGQGKNNQEIAQALHLTAGTVKNHITRILCQLGVRDRTQAALWAQQNLGKHA